MSPYSPPSLSRVWIGAMIVFVAVLIAYSLIIIQQPILGIFPVLVIGVLYLIWRFLTAIEAIADALQRIADEREQN